MMVDIKTDGPASVGLETTKRGKQSEADPRMELVPLESILITEELFRRPSRPPDYQTESLVLVELAQALADSPRTILQIMAEKILKVFRCQSAGFSLVTKDEQRFVWPAIAGEWKPHTGGGTPRDFGPCGDVLDQNAPLLFTHFERRYPYLSVATPQVEECLLVPFYVAGKAVGTVWAIAHDERRKFDPEDLRMLQSLSRFASAAYQAVEFQQVQEARVAELKAITEGAVQSESLVAERGLALAAMKLADQRKDEFLAMLAHELRNPMAAISMALSILERVQDDPVQMAKHFQMARRQMTNLVRLVDDLLDVSRITRGFVELRTEEMDLATALQNALAVARPIIEARGHELSVKVSAGSFRLNADATRLEQVLVNLLENAAKYTEPGGTISLSLARELTDGKEQAVVRVRDSGRGLPKDMLDKVFDPFVQVSQGIDRSMGGLGVGLTLVKRLLEMHGGAVSAHSDGLGTGSEFVMRLPLARAPAGAFADVRPSSSLAASSKQRILVVEDSPDVSDTLKDFLELLGHRVTVARDGLEGATLISQMRPDLALVDVGLPGIDGYEVARRVRSAPGGEKVYLVALTGYGGPEARIKAKNAGFDLHMTKPFDINELAKVLSHFNCTRIEGTTNPGAPLQILGPVATEGAA